MSAHPVAQWFEDAAPKPLSELQAAHLPRCTPENLRVGFSVTKDAPEAERAPLPPGDWWCPECRVGLDGSRVTFHERCDTCGTPVTVSGLPEVMVLRDALRRAVRLGGAGEHYPVHRAWNDEDRAAIVAALLSLPPEGT